jgi:hypothetical protein
MNGTLAYGCSPKSMCCVLLCTCLEAQWHGATECTASMFWKYGCCSLLIQLALINDSSPTGLVEDLLTGRYLRLSSLLLLFAK